MSLFTEKIIEFLDYSTTFCELMTVVVSLKPDFVISSLPHETKVIFSYEFMDKDQIDNFKCHILSYFGKKRLVSDILYKKTTVEIIME